MKVNIRAKQQSGIDPTVSMPTNFTYEYKNKQLGFSEEDVKDPYDPALPNDYVDVVRDRKEAWRNREMDHARNEKLKVSKLVSDNIWREEGDTYIFSFLITISYVMYIHVHVLCVFQEIERERESMQRERQETVRAIQAGETASIIEPTIDGGRGRGRGRGNLSNLPAWLTQQQGDAQVSGGKENEGNLPGGLQPPTSQSPIQGTDGKARVAAFVESLGLSRSAGMSSVPTRVIVIHNLVSSRWPDNPNPNDCSTTAKQDIHHSCPLGGTRRSR